MAETFGKMSLRAKCTKTDIWLEENRNQLAILHRLFSLRHTLFETNLGMIDEDCGPEVGDGFDHFTPLGVVRLSQFVVLLFHLKDLSRCLLGQTESRETELSKVCILFSLSS